MNLYTKAISMAPGVPTYYSNRAAAWIRVGAFREALLASGGKAMIFCWHPLLISTDMLAVWKIQLNWRGCQQHDTTRGC